MSYLELSPERLLAGGLTSPETAGAAWRVRWTGGVEAAASLCRASLPPVVGFSTSGSTGPSRRWERSREALWAEAGMLADLVAPDRPEAVVAFAPPVHTYGALATGLMPPHLQVPVWYRSSFFGALPAVPPRVVVVATPWIFTLLLENLAWVRSRERLTVLYSGAMLPATATRLLARAGPGRAAVVEVLGSTEAGGLATRRWSDGSAPSWTLFPDVTPAGGPPETGVEMPLRVHSPRLASRPGEPAPRVWVADDRVEWHDDRTFRLSGRTGRLVKVNGRRINLDEAEHDLSAVLDCADLALLPITDSMIGEHVELLVVLRPGTELSGIGLADAFTQLGVRPKRVLAVGRIERSALGKLRHGSSSEKTQAEVSAT